MGYDTHCPRQLAREGHASMWHRRQGQYHWKLFIDRFVCPRRLFPGYWMSESLPCHQQSFSTPSFLISLLSFLLCKPKHIYLHTISIFFCEEHTFLIIYQQNKSWVSIFYKWPSCLSISCLDSSGIHSGWLQISCSSIHASASSWPDPHLKHVCWLLSTSGQSGCYRCVHDSGVTQQWNV